MEDIKKPKTNNEWEGFVKGDVLNFMIANDIQSININDGSGKKGVIRRNAQGEYKVQTTSSETM